MAKFRIWGMIDVEIEADTEDEALEEFNNYMDEIVASCTDIALIEED